MQRLLEAAVAVLAFGALSVHAAGGVHDNETITVTDPDTLQWQDYPGLPGVKFVVIQGNPKEPGLYTIRAKFAPHTMSKPHWHPEARYVTVLQGTWWAGTGDLFDPDATVPLPQGSFAVHTPKEVHYDGAKDEEVIVQISGMGPSGTNIVPMRTPAR